MLTHRFTKTFKVMSTCDYCEKQMFIGTGLECKECKYKCHKECESNVTSACGIPQELVDEFRRALRDCPPSNQESASTVGRSSFSSYARRSISSTSPNLNASLRTLRSPTSLPPPPSLTPVPPPVLPSNAQFMHHLTKSFPSSVSVSASLTSTSSSPFLGLDSSSNTSSCTSSSPSSPAILTASLAATNPKQHFQFPEINEEPFSPNAAASIAVSAASIEATNTSTCDSATSLTPLPSTIAPVIGSSIERCSPLSPPSPLTPSTICVDELSDTCHSDRTITISSVDSTERSLAFVFESQDSQNSDTDTVVDEDKWDIRFDEVKLEKLIGTGRFATVYRASWHGDVAVKIFNKDYLRDTESLENFFSEVRAFQKTRHENLVLFMGACVKLPHLAIVTSLIRGLTLYSHLHLRKDKFNMGKILGIAQQVCQGMGYLHSKGIVHKDLKTKNIFFENGKIVIGDFGLFAVTKLCNDKKFNENSLFLHFMSHQTDANFMFWGRIKNRVLEVSIGWLCYLAPEIIKSLTVESSNTLKLPFSERTDVYAFGTVWYELLCGEWPFRDQASEAIIWQIGSGIKQSLANIQTTRDVKEILMRCWSFNDSQRPDFAHDLLEMLKKLPKKRLARSPSHPVHLSKSAESLF